MNDSLNRFTEGIIVKTIDYKETNKIAYIITRNGLETVEFRGANKVNSHTKYYSDTLSKISYEVKGHFFSSGKVISSYTNIKLNLNKIKEVLEILELSYTLISHIIDYKLFYDFLSVILDLIEDAKDDEIKFYTAIFYLKTLYLLGIAPNFTRCTECNTNKNLVGFVFSSGGMKCKEHLRMEDKIYDIDVTNDVRHLYLIKLDKMKEEIDNYKDLDYDKIKDFYDEYYNTYLGYSSKSNKVFSKLKM